MAMILKGGYKVYRLASIICVAFTAVEAIDKHANQYYIGADAEIVTRNISALQLDEPNPADSKDHQPADASPDSKEHTHSHVVSNTASTNDQALPSFPGSDIPVSASSEIECPCAQKL